MKDAQLFRNAVKAIRRSEEADDFYGAGLLSRAVKIYEESLGYFTDAYCIQSRLALRLADMGEYDKAQDHYKRAYELMPESFGRVESHCFGCEKAFDGAQAQNTAEKVFTDLLKKTPTKPQVHYLMGYLEAEREHFKEAVRHFQDAVALDKDYLKAWEHLQSAGMKADLPRAEIEKAVFNTLRLDPQGKHSSVDVRTVSDLKSLWQILEKSRDQQPQKPSSLYPLKVSADRIEEKMAADSRWKQEFIWQESNSFVMTDRFKTPANAVAQNSWVEIGQQLLSFSFEPDYYGGID